MDDDEKLALGIIAILFVVGFLFLAPVNNGEPVMTVENGEVGTTIGDGGIGDLGGGGTGGDTGEEPTDNDEEEPTGEPCVYPESFDIPTRSWWFTGQRCPLSVRDFFDEADEVDCYEIDSTGDPYEYRREITSWYDDWVQDELNWERVDVQSGYVNREDCWAWGAIYYCEYNDKGMIVLFGFCPASTERTGNGAFGQALGDWDYMSERAARIEEIVEEVMD